MFSPIRIAAGNPGAMTGAGNNTYLLVSEGVGVLVDAGVGAAAHLADLARRLTSANATLLDVLVTHAHGDHASGSGALAADYSDARFRKFPWPDQDRQFPVQWHAVRDGEEIACGGEMLVALHTPGHSPDHLAFLHRATATVFCGDLVIPGSSVIVPFSRGGDLTAYLQSLQRLIDLHPSLLLPAHGDPVEQPDLLLHRYVAHRLERERQVQDALDAGRDTVSSIAEFIYDGLPPVFMPAARENVRAHLDKLRREGRVVEDAQHWRRWIAAL